MYTWIIVHINKVYPLLAPTSVKYFRAAVGCTVSVGPFGFGRCVSTAWIGSVYLQDFPYKKFILKCRSHLSPFLVTAIGFRSQFNHGVQWYLDVGQIRLRQAVEIGVSSEGI